MFFKSLRSAGEGWGVLTCLMKTHQRAEAYSWAAWGVQERSGSVDKSDAYYPKAEAYSWRAWWAQERSVEHWHVFEECRRGAWSVDKSDACLSNSWGIFLKTLRSAGEEWGVFTSLMNTYQRAEAYSWTAWGAKERSGEHWGAWCATAPSHPPADRRAGPAWCPCWHQSPAGWSHGAVLTPDHIPVGTKQFVRAIPKPLPCQLCSLCQNCWWKLSPKLQ